MEKKEKKRKEKSVFPHNVLSSGGQPAAQKEISAAQTRIENQRFFDILGLFLQVFVIMRPKKSIFLAKFSSCGPETILGWPPLVLSF
jgi:hypothetical protein